MRIFETLPRGVRRLVRLPLPLSRSHLLRDLDDEIRFHIEACVEAARAAGISDSEARAAALARFGDVDDLRAYCATVATRRARRRSIRDALDAWIQDLRFAVRQFARTPAFTITAIAILALGVGASAAIFSVVHHLLIAPLPYADGNRMVELMATSAHGNVYFMPGPEMVAEWRARTRAVDHVMGLWDGQKMLGDTTRPNVDRVSFALVQPQVFDYVGVHPILGRPIVPSDTFPGAPPVVLIGHSFWERSFGGSDRALGQRILLDGTAHTIIGVMPEGFFVPFADDARDAFIAMPAGTMAKPTGVIAKLRPGVSIDMANRELRALFTHAATNNGEDPPRVVRVSDLTRGTTRQIIVVLFCAVCLVLLIACANVANMLLARAWSRQRELAVRAALGAGRTRLVRLMLTESMLLAVLAGVAGIAVARGALRLIIAAQPSNMTTLDGVRIEAAVLWWSLGISIVTGLLFGAAPALFAADERLDAALKSSARSAGSSRAARRFRGCLVVFEVALSVVLLASAGLLMRTVVALRHVDLGFDPHGLVGISLGLGSPRLADFATRGAVMEGIRARALAIPGVHAASAATTVPPEFGIAMGAFQIDGRPAAARDSLALIGFNAVDTTFFHVVGLRLLRGRVFEPSTELTDRTAGGEVVINESTARRFWSDGDALGAHVRWSSRQPWSTVVGIVADMNTPSVHSLGKDIQMYGPKVPGSALSGIVVRSDLPMPTLVAALTKAIHEVNPAVRALRPESAEEYVAHAADTQRFVLTLLATLATLAVVLAAVGLYGVVAYSVSRRTREIGVRVALGAQARDVVRLVVGSGVALSGAGIVVGAGSAALATRALRSWLYGVAPGDPMTLAGVAVVLLVVAILATVSPARRAMRLDPVDALRAE